LNKKTKYRNLNLSDLRSLVGYVGQEPVLYGGTIRSNLVFGRPVDSVTDDEIWRVLDAVNAAEFVRKLLYVSATSKLENSNGFGSGNTTREKSGSCGCVWLR